MRKHLLPIVLFFLFTVPVQAADKTTKEDLPGDLNKFLVDITGGAVSASNLVGMDKSAISQIETSQDLVAAIQPFSTGDQKTGMGLAITPARTSILPMSAYDYANSGVSRLLGSLTFSYAQNSEDLSKVSYRKSAYSIDTVYYLSKEEDPIIIGSRAFKTCADPTAAQNGDDINTIVMDSKLSTAAKQTLLEALTAKRAVTLSKCIDDTLKKVAKWNSSRVSLSYGEARIKAPGGDNNVLGKHLTLNGQFKSGEQGVLHASFRKIRDALDTKTLGTAALATSNSSLAAIRYTHGDVEGTDMRVLIEYSNAKSRAASVVNQAFIYALGIDKNLAKGMWLEFRLGRNRTLEGDKEQSVGMLNLSFQPSLSAFKK